MVYHACIPGSRNFIKTADWSGVEPDAPGIGVIKEEVSDGSEVVELITINLKSTL